MGYGSRDMWEPMRALESRAVPVFSVKDVFWGHVEVLSEGFPFQFLFLVCALIALRMEAWSELLEVMVQLLLLWRVNV